MDDVPFNDILDEMETLFQEHEKSVIDFLEENKISCIDLNKSPVKKISKAKQYELGEVIAQGGMGAILRARDVNCRRTVAMKVLLEKNKKNKDFIKRFIEEAMLTAQLEHPNIVPIYELGINKSGNPYYTMKLINGRTLKEILTGIAQSDAQMTAAFPLNRLLTIFIRICDAVAYAHSKNVIHRDLKPENIMVGDFGEVQVMDWGLAKVIDAKTNDTPTINEQIESIRFDETDGLQTIFGSILGTPAFMPPEQAQSELIIDPRSDIYTLGGILYNILCLRPPVIPFAIANNLPELFDYIINGTIQSPSSITDGKVKLSKHEPEINITLSHCPDYKVPSSLSAVAMKALSKDPDQRYQSVKDLQVEIENYLDGFATDAEEAGLFKHFMLLIKRHKELAFSLMVAFIILVSLTVVFINRIQKEKSKALLQKNLAEKAQILAEENEQKAKDKTDELQTVSRSAAPRFIADAVEAVNHKDWDLALKTIDLAVDLDSSNNLGWYHKGRIHLANLEFKKAHAAFKKAQEFKCSEENLARHLKLCEDFGKFFVNDKKPLDKILVLISELKKMSEYALTTRMASAHDSIKNNLIATEKYYEKNGARFSYQIRDDGIYVNIAGAKDIQVLKDLKIHDLYISDSPDIDDLSVLNTLPLRKLYITNNRKIQTFPILNIPTLKNLKLHDFTNLKDIHGLSGLKLNYLDLYSCRNLKSIKGIESSRLKELKLNLCESLESIEDIAGQPLEHLELAHTYSLKSFKGIEKVPLKNLVLNTISKHIKDLKLLANLPLEEISLKTDLCTYDLSPIGKIKSLKKFNRLGEYQLFQPAMHNFVNGNRQDAISKLDKLASNTALVPLLKDLSDKALLFKKQILIFKEINEQKFLEISHLPQFENHHIMFNPLSSRWNKAVNYSRRLGGRLASVNSLEKLNFINETYPFQLPTIIGGEKINDRWTWLSGEKWSFTNWGHGQPAFDNNRSHLHIGIDRKFADYIKNEGGMVSLIEWDLEQKNLLQRSVQQVKDFLKTHRQSDSLVEFKGKQYMLVPILMNHIEALNYCKNNNLKIVTISSEQEKSFLIKSFPNLQVWTGAGFNNESGWFWNSGEKWELPQPGNPVRDEKSLLLDTVSKSLIKVSHRERMMFIVEWKK